MSAIGDAGLTHLTLLSGNENYTVSSTGTIDGSRSVLQHGDTLYFRRVKIVECLRTEVLVAVAYFHIVRIDIAIDNEQWLLGCRTHFTE